MKTLDMTGKPCPIPVVEAKKALAAGEGAVEVLVDNAVAVENLKKMALGLGFSFESEQLFEFGFSVRIAGDGAAEASADAQPEAIADLGGATVLIGCDRLGRGSEELGKLLIKGFIFALSELPDPPLRLIFLNSGVKLAVSGSGTLQDLRTLIEKGTSIHACGTCLNYYGLTDSLAVGDIVDMFFIAGALNEAARLITL